MDNQTQPFEQNEPAVVKFDRPKKLTPEMALAVATEMAEALAADAHIDAADVAVCAKDIAKHASPYMDGYELAKALEDYAHWDCHFPLAEALDGFSFMVRLKIEAAEKEWAQRNNVQPQHTIGTRVKLDSGETGLITDIYEHGAAKYLVKIDGDKDADKPTQSRRIVDFEDAAAL